jgi:hypothetical protein
VCTALHAFCRTLVSPVITGGRFPPKDAASFWDGEPGLLSEVLNSAEVFQECKAFNSTIWITAPTPPMQSRAMRVILTLIPDLSRKEWRNLPQEDCLPAQRDINFLCGLTVDTASALLGIDNKGCLSSFMDLKLASASAAAILLNTSASVKQAGEKLKNALIAIDRVQDQRPRWPGLAFQSPRTACRNLCHFVRTTLGNKL